MYNVRVPYPFLWSFGGPFYGPFDRRRWPRTEAATVVEEEIIRFESIPLNDERPALQMRWEVTIEANGGFSLRAEWNHLRRDDSN